MAAAVSVQGTEMADQNSQQHFGADDTQKGADLQLLE